MWEEVFEIEVAPTEIKDPMETSFGHWAREA
jgi:hypothetical protein